MFLSAYRPRHRILGKLDRCKLHSEAQFYCFLFHKSQKSFTVASPCPANPECSILNSFSPCLIAAYPDENGPTHAGPEEVGHTWTVGIPSICFAGTWNESSRRAWHVRLSSI